MKRDMNNTKVFQYDLISWVSGDILPGTVRNLCYLLVVSYSDAPLYLKPGTSHKPLISVV